MKSKLTRRQFLRTAAAAASLSFATGGCLPAGQKTARSYADKKKPNIIFLLTDDQRAGTLGCEGHPVIKTPNIDSLAENGVRFHNAFIAEPVCSPSRATYFTGQYERTHRVGFSSPHNMSDLQWEDTYPAILQKAGYYTGFIGKFGLEHYDFKPHAEEKFDFWLGHDGWGAFFPKNKPNCKMYKDIEPDIVTPIMADCMDEFLDAAPSDQPFCLSVSFSAPHGSISGSMYMEEVPEGGRMYWKANENPKIKDHPIYGDLYRDEDVRIPRQTESDPYRHIPEDVLPQEMRMITYDYNYEKDKCLEHHYRYFQLIAGLDKAVGSLLDSLKERRLDDNTVIIYSSDHGLLMGEYGMGGKSLLYDLTTRIPFIISDPRLPAGKKGRVEEDFVVSTDVAPTIVGLAGLDVPGTMQGIDLTKPLYKQRYNRRQEVYLESLYAGRNNPLMEAIRTYKYKYVRFFPNPGRPEPPQEYNPHYGWYPNEVLDLTAQQPIFEQFFDLEKDPGEQKNLINDPALRKTIDRFRGKCEQRSSRITAFARKYSRSRAY